MSGAFRWALCIRCLIEFEVWVAKGANTVRPEPRDIKTWYDDQKLKKRTTNQSAEENSATTVEISASSIMKRNLVSIPRSDDYDLAASIFKGEALDTVADVMSWLVLVIAPVIGITVFWLVHILPEKIAEKKKHPQAKAIQCLCLLSLAFGGLLWPLAWLWAYSKPVLYKMAYGTDKVAHGHEDDAHSSSDKDEADELKQLRKRIAELETKRAGKPAAEGGKA